MPLILTRILLPYETAAKWEAGGRPGFGDPYAVHQRAWECFPDRPEAARDFLTRVDPQSEHLRILVLSPEIPVRPDWCPDGCAWQSKVIDEETFFSRERYRFSLLANPTRKVRSNKMGERLKNSRRVPVTSREDLVAWLQRKADQHGFSIDPARLRTVARPRQSFVRPPKSDAPRQSGTLHAVDFQGVLTVTDREKLRAAFASGIGPAKAFGFGMLCLAPLSPAD
jgi:CRISPR system Cascade subunit CasE